ncbi:methyltransferase family protein [Ancylobacter radicis]|uniref:Isoprenylcysteine carboxylmethyltransferase family protein n=1 Tax=Ancylobacter radicis TaxID=2836179 RepID=A0ABS5R7L4_9HYPH|nr:isoprenylcysteine carboxylmethyltransferase family protein [Ancylobacter radicis]MBS9476804.1 isoprenylcysteine carboxylmethyltransferase family protein [Ancylobacter radicis]
MSNAPNATPALDIGAVQHIRKLVLFGLGGLAVGVLLFSHSLWADTTEHGLHETIEIVGLGLMLLAIVGRTWCSLYIGGRKKNEVVALGPYSICRNPLYVFSFIGAAGAGAQFGSITAALAATLLTVLVFTIVVRKEERFLTQKFGEAYLAYKARVPRFIPNFRLWENVDALEIRTQLVMRTFLDACVFLAAIPLAEGIEMAQGQGLLPVLWLVP